MANGSTITDIFSGDRARTGILVVVMTTLASGMGWFFKQESNSYADEAINLMMRERVVPRMEARSEFTDLRYRGLEDRLDKTEAQAARNGAEFRDVWAAIAARIDRQALADTLSDEHRRLEVLERQLDALRATLYGGPRNP